MNIQVASSHHGKYRANGGHAAITENTEPTGDTQPARKKQSLWQNSKNGIVSANREKQHPGISKGYKNIGDIEDIPNTELKIHLLYRTGAAVFMKIHAAASYFSFKIVIIISYMKCCFGAAKTDCTDIGFLK